VARAGGQAQANRLTSSWTSEKVKRKFAMSDIDDSELESYLRKKDGM
jgi:hypothetical protein